MAHTFRICNRGRELRNNIRKIVKWMVKLSNDLMWIYLRNTRKVTSPTRCNSNANGIESFFCFQARVGHHMRFTFFEPLLRYSWSRDARHKLLMNCNRAGRQRRSAASANKFSAWCDRVQSTFAVSAWLSNVSFELFRFFRIDATFVDGLCNGVCKKL